MKTLNLESDARVNIKLTKRNIHNMILSSSARYKISLYISDDLVGVYFIKEDTTIVVPLPSIAYINSNITIETECRDVKSGTVYVSFN